MRNTINKLQELAASNLSSLIARAEDPAKMLGLLRSELQESILAVQGELSSARRKAERKRAEAERLALSAESWSDKAKLAMQHAREDLARSALLVRETERAGAEALAAEAGGLDADALALAGTMEQLETILAETLARSSAEAGGGSKLAAATPARGTERIMDRIGQLEKRLGFAETELQAATAASIESEIERMAREARVEAELAELRQQASAPKRKGKTPS